MERSEGWELGPRCRRKFTDFRLSRRRFQACSGAAVSGSHTSEPLYREVGSDNEGEKSSPSRVSLLSIFVFHSTFTMTLRSVPFYRRRWDRFSSGSLPQLPQELRSGVPHPGRADTSQLAVRGRLARLALCSLRVSICEALRLRQALE